MPDAVGGLIGVRWRSWGGEDGPFGFPLGPEEDVPGFNGRRQPFQRGEIVWSPDQGMVVSAFRLYNEVLFQWEATGHGYDYFRLHFSFDGRQTLLDKVRVGKETTSLWTRLQGAGDYTFAVDGMHSKILGSDEGPEGYTIPVRVSMTFTAADESQTIPVTGLIAARWQELGGADGWLGKPIAEASTEFGQLSQDFERGAIQTVPALGPEMVLAIYQRGPAAIELDWGPTQPVQSSWRIDIFKTGDLLSQTEIRTDLITNWARPNRGSGHFRFTGLGAPSAGDLYVFRFFANHDVDGIPTTQVADPLQSAAAIIFWLPLADPLPAIPLGVAYSPAYAFASHSLRVNAFMQDYAVKQPILAGSDFPAIEAGENETIAMIAHLHCASTTPGFRVPGELPSAALVHVMLRYLTRGTVGTTLDSYGPLNVKRDYDMALKGLAVIAYRYRHMITDEELDYIIDSLVPATLQGGHDEAIMSYPFDVKKLLGSNPFTLAFIIEGLSDALGIGSVAMAVIEDFAEAVLALGPEALSFAETENHVVMIEGSRYLFNQLRFDRTRDRQYDNNANGLTEWLLGHLQTFAQLELLEFNARPYNRMIMHMLLDLHEFARDESVQTAATILLDYFTVKFAVSSSRDRRVGPFRRKTSRINVPDGVNNDLFGDGRGDPLTGLFLTYTGLIQPNGSLTQLCPAGWALSSVVAGPAAYRPPPAAYILAMGETPPAQHVFYHGVRPVLPGKLSEPADPGFEIYFKSPSFLITAGGMFLNSGYGHDELADYDPCCYPQATTLLPARADMAYADLIRLEPYPDERSAVNTGVHQGFACGAQLVIPAYYQTLAKNGHGQVEGPWTILDLDADLPGYGRLGLYVAAFQGPSTDPGLIVSPPLNLGFFTPVRQAPPTRPGTP